MPNDRCRVIVRYSGMVQGVGFRYTTVNIARGYDVAGYVQNMQDGSVRLVVEGERRTVNQFLEAVDEQLGRHIKHKDQNQAEMTGEFGPPSCPDAFFIHY